MDELRLGFLEPAFDAPIQELSDEDFLKAILWERTAPQPLTHAARQGDAATFCRELQGHRFGLVGGGRKRSAVKQAFEKQSLWSREAFEPTPRTDRLIRLWMEFPGRPKRSRRKIGTGRSGERSLGPDIRRSTGTGNGRADVRLRPTNGKRGNSLLEWLNAADSPFSPLESLIVHEILLEAGHELPVEVCWLLWRTALRAAIEFPRPSQPLRTDSATATADHRLVLDGELPWQFGLLFGSIQGAERLRRAGQRALRKQLIDRTDTDGTPEAGLLERLPLWLAPLARSAHWAQRFRTRLWDEASAERFRGLMRIIAPFCRPDRQLALSNDFGDGAAGLLTTALRLAGWTSRSRPMRYLQDVSNGSFRNNGRKTSNRLSTDRPGGHRPRGGRPVTQSDWARLACLRSAWSVDADTLLIAHHRDKPIIELVMLGQPLLQGVWDIEVTSDGKALRFEGDWSCTCWFSDHDADYLELQMNAGHGVQVDRQVLLSRTNHFALLADIVSGSAGRRIEYSSRLPVVDSVHVEPDTSTRECVLKARRQRPNGTRCARAFPLALPADRVMSTSGAFGPVGGVLELKQSAIGGLYAPVVIDWAPARRRSYADWRTLTVTEQRRVLKSDAASGHRLRIGKHQLLIYRSVIRSEEGRAVLGQHTANETVIGHFDADGEFDPIIEVE